MAREHNETTVITVGSLFAGIGGLELGLERAGVSIKWQVEIDPYCRKVLAKHWPDVKRYEDVREVGSHNLEPVDLICGGFPCQDISNAGKRAGIEGERSGLWSEFYRIICELRPRYVLVENVRALLVRGMDRVLGDLADGGYDAEWDCIPAAAFGFSHVRERLFIIAHERLGASNTEYVRCASGRNSDEREACRTCGNGCATEAEGEYRGISSKTSGAILGSHDPIRGHHDRGRAVRRVDDLPELVRTNNGVSAGVDRIRGLGNAVVPQVAEWIGRRIVAAGKRPEAV